MDDSETFNNLTSFTFPVAKPNTDALPPPPLPRPKTNDPNLNLNLNYLNLKHHSTDKSITDSECYYYHQKSSSQISPGNTHGLTNLALNNSTNRNSFNSPLHSPMSSISNTSNLKWDFENSDSLSSTTVEKSKSYKNSPIKRNSMILPPPPPNIVKSSDNSFHYNFNNSNDEYYPNIRNISLNSGRKLCHRRSLSISSKGLDINDLKLSNNLNLNHNHDHNNNNNNNSNSNSKSLNSTTSEYDYKFPKLYKPEDNNYIDDYIENSGQILKNDSKIEDRDMETDEKDNDEDEDEDMQIYSVLSNFNDESTSMVKCSSNSNKSSFSIVEGERIILSRPSVVFVTSSPPTNTEVNLDVLDMNVDN